MSTAIYNEILARVQLLTPNEQLRLLRELDTLVRQQESSHLARSILELEGLGKELWDGVDAQQYVEQERASWNG